MRDSGELRAIRDSDAFDGAGDATGSNIGRDSGSFDTLRDSAGFDTRRDSGEFGALRESAGFGPVSDSAAFRALPPGYQAQDPRRTGQERRDRRAPERPDATGQRNAQGPERRNLRYTPTVAASGPMAPVPPPPEFTDPRPSGPLRGSSLLRSAEPSRGAGPSGAADPRRQTGAQPRPGSRRETGPQGQPAARRTPPQALLASPLVGPQAQPPSTSGPQALSPYTSGPQATPPYTTGPPARPPRPGGPQAKPPYTTGPQASPPYTTGLQASPPYTTGPQATPPYTTGLQAASPYTTGAQAMPPFTTGPRAMPPYATGPRAAAGRDTGPERPSRPRRAIAQQADGLDGQDGLDGRRAQQGQGILRRLRDTGDERPEPGSADRLIDAFATALRSRNWVTGLAVPILAAIAVGIAVVVIAGANSGLSGLAPSTLSAGYPPARSAAADFTDTAALAGRGISEPLGQVAVFGSEIVAVGSQSGARIDRARFFFSVNAGRTWQLGTVQEQGAAVPPPGHAATLVAGGPHGWAAVGSTAAWVSPNGQRWLLEAALPQLPGDEITTLISTSSGFLAAGQNTAAGTAGPVVWLSANGTTWERFDGSQLGLTAGTGRVLGVTAAAANGGVIVLSETVAGATTSSAVWRSVTGGMSWTPVTIPAGGGAAATISGLAPLKEGFVAVRPAVIGRFTRAAVYVSGDGTTWRRSAVLATADNAPLTVGLVAGQAGGGAVVTGEARGLLFAFLSADGVTWSGTDPFGTAAGERLSGVVLTSTGQALTAGTSAGDAAQQRPLLSLIGTQGGPDQINLRAIPGAIGTELAVNAIAASGATQVAVGSADGFPALWQSTDGGSTWQRATGASAGVLTRPGDEQLTSVAHGAAGWLAVGGGVGSTAEHPVVVGSADGQTWAAEDGATAFTGPGLVVTATAAGPAGYVIVGQQTANGHTVAAAWYAPGLTGWQRAADAEPGALDGTGNRELAAVTATAKGFAAVGAVGSSPAAWLSAGGRTWSLVMLPLPGAAVSAELQYVAASGDTVAATGTEVTAAGQQLPFAAVSDDGGATWAETALPVPRGAAQTAVTALAAAGGGFTATGMYGTPGNEDVVVWTLAQGARPSSTWTAATPAGTGLAGTGTQAITALTDTGSTLTGVGFSATPASEEPTIWQSPVRS